ncbi:MAG: tRNA (adenosine(37)-N6)-dimethylallyltransferase MiaA [Proteobacteria bacterium]|nr:tRNA (adenosine(37)-N6)-dimethylallyltransferase MiaA [Pseudomonadota bacterium]
MTLLDELRPDLPVLIAGPTASGKSALALEIAARQGGIIVNADALQVWRTWRILTARPTEEEEARARHRLYGQVAPGNDYSVGHWLREVAPLLAGPERVIIVGGTGLYLTALTEGLAEIPPTPPEVRAEADRRMATEGPAPMLAELEAGTAARIDRLNPARIQRAWEVQRATGRGLAAWQDDTAAPLLPLSRAQPLVLVPDRDWLARRIDTRFDRMLQEGALDEVRRVLPYWDPAALWARAIGAPELVSHLRGDMAIDAARDAAQAASRQYAKRQRTWFRSRMKEWRCVTLP